MKLMNHFLYLINGYPYFSCLNKSLKKKQTKIEKERVEVTPTDRRKKTVKDWSDEILGFDLLFVG